MHDACVAGDHTNKAASEFFVSSVLSAVDHPAVDGTFTDDVTGLPNEHHAVTGRINMTQPQLRALQQATAAAHAKLVAGLIARGKYNWQAFFGNDVAFGDDAAGVQIGRGEMCTRFMRRYCAPPMQQRALMMHANDSGIDNQTLAAFLIVRPPIAYLGWGWESDDRFWDDRFLLQPGVPRGGCQEMNHSGGGGGGGGGGSGVFWRQWSHGVARLDCGRWSADLPFPSLL
jgi:hypothetical protein